MEEHVYNPENSTFLSHSVTGYFHKYTLSSSGPALLSNLIILMAEKLGLVSINEKRLSGASA